MYILSQDGREMIIVRNMSNVFKCPCCNSLVAILVNNNKIRIGEYATEEEAYEVFAKLRAALKNGEAFEMPQSEDEEFEPRDSICDDEEELCEDFPER